MSQPSSRNTLVLLSGLGFFIAWAALFDIDQSVRATGSGAASCRPTVTTRSPVTVCATSTTGPIGIESPARGGCMMK
jgi:hypothetical protein